MMTRALAFIAVFMAGFCYTKMPSTKTVATAPVRDVAVDSEADAWMKATEHRISVLEGLAGVSNTKLVKYSRGKYMEKGNYVVDNVVEDVVTDTAKVDSQDNPEDKPKATAPAPQTGGGYGSTGSRAVASGYGSTGSRAVSSGYGSTGYSMTYSAPVTYTYATTYSGGSTGYSGYRQNYGSTGYSTARGAYSNVSYRGPVRRLLANMPIVRRFATNSNYNMSRSNSFSVAPQFSGAYSTYACDDPNCVCIDCNCNGGGGGEVVDDGGIVSPYSTSYSYVVPSSPTFRTTRSGPRTICNQATGQCYLIE